MCDPSGKCYQRESIYQHVTIQDLPSLAAAEAAVATAVSTFPEYSYRYPVMVFACLLQILGLLGTIIMLKRTRLSSIPENYPQP